MRIATFPSTWKHAIIVPIHKPGKPANSTSYRPISLLPTLSKLYERILLERIKPYVYVIPKHQFAFLDLTQAFDKVWHSGLEQKLKTLNLPAYLLKTITSFISNRSFQVRVETDFSQLHHIKAGVPQGSVLGPTLFNIYCNNYNIPTPRLRVNRYKRLLCY
ncbi:Reverse transcriptase domain [Cinara cedri]|uniref:Reverse transcriptase domain n=1 Tax=Cinara cedri TaxID=506608 RepID=A0A5E4M8Q2_9HEMI|nr:Reverse transcriptase domain [Cinara cedri]